MRTRYKIQGPEEGRIFFITSTIVEWLPVFFHKDHFDIIIHSLEFCRTHKAMKLYAYVIMENHIHLIVSAPEMVKVVQSFKSFTAKELLDSFAQKKIDWLLNQLAFFKAKHKTQSAYQVWQEGYHPQELLTIEIMNQKNEYIHNNPVRRGYVKRPEHWQYSSAGQILSGNKGIIDVEKIA
jgi:putative transposase